MSDELRYHLVRTLQGKQSRRAFLGRAGALGISATMANTMLSSALRAETPRKGGTLVAGMQGGESTNTLDPALAASEVPFAVNMTWGEMLLDVGPTNEIEYRIAQEVSSSPDAKEWKFKIRQGVEFHNGKTVTAEDVLATIRRHTDEKSQSGALGLVQGITEMKAEGDMVTMVLKDANADFPYLMADYHLIIQPNGGLDDPAAGIGAGAYKIVSNQPGVSTQFEKHANYWDADRGHADQVEILVLNDTTARVAALQAGQVQMINRLAPKIFKLIKNVPGIRAVNTPSRAHYVFVMQCTASPFDNNDLRMAMKLAINRQEMVDKILGGLGTIGNDFPINAAYPLFDATIEQREYDPDQAAFYYKKSGHDGSPIILDVAAGAFPGAVDAAQLFQQSAQAAGIPLEIKRNPDDGYWSDVWNAVPFCTSYWSGRPVQDQMYSTAYLSTAEWNDTKFKNPQFDSMILAARGELDQTKRKAIYSDMAHILRDEGGLILPMFNDFVEAISENVQGWIADPNSELMNGRALVKCWLA
ncbi:MAG: ABC transporter substrate-binding protein [Rhodobacteraceae bacterium]|nr:ABC transporter substrate-binding protein [Paracoccaceae bacterium]